MAQGTKFDEQRLAEGLSAALADATPDLAGRLDTDPGAYLDLVRVAARAERQTQDLLRSAVEAARSAGHSWEAIGSTLGVSRQAAQKRFAHEASVESSEDARGGAAGVGEVRVVSGLTAFNEMRVLERIGRYGWHSIGYGAFHHVVRKSDKQWTHARIVGSTDTVAQLLSEGWQRIGSLWFPWTYLKRELDEPALAEEGGVGSSLA